MSYDLSPDSLKRLCGIHIGWYATRLAASARGEPGYRPNELAYYLRLWEEVQEKNYRYDLLSASARSEVNDAIADEENR